MYKTKKCQEIATYQKTFKNTDLVVEIEQLLVTEFH